MSSDLEKNQKYAEVIGSKVKLTCKPVAMKLIESEKHEGKRNHFPVSEIVPHVDGMSAMLFIVLEEGSVGIRLLWSGLS